MNFLKKLFSGGGSSGDGRATFFYVKPHRCDDILKVRIDTYNDLSQRDEGSGFWVRKLASSGNYKCNQVEITLYFNSSKRIEDQEIQGGTFVDEAAYNAWAATQAPSTEES